MKVTAVVLLATCLCSYWTVQGNVQQSANQTVPRPGALPGAGTPPRPGQQLGFGQPGFGAQPFGQQPGLQQPGFGLRQPGFGSQTFGQQPSLRQPGFGLQSGAAFGTQPAAGRQVGPFGPYNYPMYQYPYYAYDYGMCTLDPRGSGYNVRGIVRLRQLKRNQYNPFSAFNPRPLEMVINITGLTPNQNHGFRAHTWGDMSNGCASAADIYNPFGVQHGGPNDYPFPNAGYKTRTVGDFGNLLADQFGQVNTERQDRVATLSTGSLFDIVGRSLVVFERPDDLGTTGTGNSLITGNTGNRMACCVIGRADPTSWPGNQALIPQPRPGQPSPYWPSGSYGQFGQPSVFPGQPFRFPGQPFPTTNTRTNPGQPVLPNQPNQPNTQTSPFNPTNPFQPFNPNPGQFQPGLSAPNPFGLPFAGPIGSRGFSPVDPNPAGTFGASPGLGAVPVEQQDGSKGKKK